MPQKSRKELPLSEKVKAPDWINRKKKKKKIYWDKDESSIRCITFYSVQICRNYFYIRRIIPRDFLTKKLEVRIIRKN